MSSVGPMTDVARTGSARFLSVALFAAVVLVAGYRINIPPPMAETAAIGLFCMGCWATGAIPEIVTTLLFFASPL